LGLTTLSAEDRVELVAQESVNGMAGVPFGWLVCKAQNSGKLFFWGAVDAKNQNLRQLSQAQTFQRVSSGARESR